MEALKNSVPEGALPKVRGRYSRYSQARLARKLNKLQFAAADCLMQILADGEAKAADRISAAKLAFDAAGRAGAEQVNDGFVRVVIEGMPEEYAQ